MNQLLTALVLIALCSLSSLTVAQTATPDDRDNACISYVPNAISPNGDGINDLFEVQHSCKIDEFVLQIYDESEQLIHESSDIDQYWDGVYEGDPVPEGHYIWVISYMDENQNRQINYRGEVILVR